MTIDSRDTSVTQKPTRSSDQPFWARYSPHHELPLSISSSIFLHAAFLALIGLILVGFADRLFRPRPTLRAPDLIGLTGDGGNPGGPRGDGGIDNSAAAIPAVSESRASQGEASTTEPAIDLNVPDRPKLLPEEHGGVVERNLGGPNLDQRARQVRDKLAKLTPKKRGDKDGPGGPGEGEKIPGETGPKFRQERQNRWMLVFQTRDGADYLAKLHALGAILVTPNKAGDWLVYRNLKNPPLLGKTEQVPPDRIFWIDDESKSIQSLALAMGLKSSPEYIAAFFPASLEDHLRKLEKDRFSGKEEDIELTRFRVVQHGNKYVVELVEVKTRK